MPRLRLYVGKIRIVAFKDQIFAVGKAEADPGPVNQKCEVERRT
jgi:hypothetical protein